MIHSGKEEGWFIYASNYSRPYVDGRAHIKNQAVAMSSFCLVVYVLHLFYFVSASLNGFTRRRIHFSPPVKRLLYFREVSS